MGLDNVRAKVVVPATGRAVTPQLPIPARPTPSFKAEAPDAGLRRLGGATQARVGNSLYAGPVSSTIAFNPAHIKALLDVANGTMTRADGTLADRGDHYRAVNTVLMG